MTWQTRSSLTPKVLSENQWKLHWLSVETEFTHFQQAMQLYRRVRKKKKKNTRYRNCTTSITTTSIYKYIYGNERLWLKLWANHHHHHSSSIGCGAGDHKVSPCMTIISKCGNLLFLHCSFIIPKQSLYIIKVWSTWSTRSPFANGRNVQSISSQSSRLFLWHSEDVTKKFQLAVPS